MKMWSLIANSGIYGHSATRMQAAFRLLSSRERWKRKRRRNRHRRSKFRPIEHSYFEVETRQTPGHNILPRVMSLLPFGSSSCPFIPPLASCRRSERLFLSRRMKFRKFAAPFHHPRREEKRLEDGTCTSSTEVAPAKLRHKKANKFLTVHALRGTFYFSRRSSNCLLAESPAR